MSGAGYGAGYGAGSGAGYGTGYGAGYGAGSGAGYSNTGYGAGYSNTGYGGYNAGYSNYPTTQEYYYSPAASNHVYNTGYNSRYLKKRDGKDPTAAGSAPTAATLEAAPPA